MQAPMDHHHVLHHRVPLMLLPDSVSLQRLALLVPLLTHHQQHLRLCVNVPYRTDTRTPLSKRQQQNVINSVKFNQQEEEEELQFTL